MCEILIKHSLVFKNAEAMLPNTPVSSTLAHTIECCEDANAKAYVFAC